MTRFLKSLSASLAVVLTIGLAVAVGAGHLAPEVPATSAATLAQAEDETSQDAVDDGEPTPALQLSRIERLLAQLTPPVESTGLATAQRVVLSRDPFQPVVPVTGDGTTGDGTTGDGTAGDGTTGDGTTGDGTTDEDDKCTDDDVEAVCVDEDKGSFVVTLDDITDGGFVVVTINDTTYTVAEDEFFANHFQVKDVNTTCATLLFGDEAFSICTGATVLK